MSQIESIICKYQRRGLEPLLQKMPSDYCVKAAEALLKVEKSNVFLCTGFYCFGNGETDGPIGTYFLYNALEKLGYLPVVVTDPYSAMFFIFKQLRCETYSHFTKADVIMDKYNVAALIAIERCGRAMDGNYYSMKGRSISAFVSPIDDLFLHTSCLSIGIGDGGNEIGMGNYHDLLRDTIKINPSVIKTDYLIASTVSNWGAYGLLTALSQITNINLLPTFEEVNDYLYYIVNMGATDGIKGPFHYSVDGFNISVEKEILDLLAEEVLIHKTIHQKNHHNEPDKSLFR